MSDKQKKKSSDSHRICEICHIRERRLENNLFFAGFPLSETRCKEWLKVVRKAELVYTPQEKLYKHRHVCGKHFKKRDFTKNGTELKKMAIPSLHLTREPLAEDLVKEFPLKTKDCRILLEHNYVDVIVKKKMKICTATSSVVKNLPSVEYRTLEPDPVQTCEADTIVMHEPLITYTAKSQQSQEIKKMSLESIRYSRGQLEVLDQLLLPLNTRYIPINGVEDGWKVINKMQVRGAPAIAIVGCLSLGIELLKNTFEDKKIMRQEIEGKLNYLVSARPTAVNIKLAADDLIHLANTLCADDSLSSEAFRDRFIDALEAMLIKDISDNKAIGRFGCEEILSRVIGEGLVNVLTHCNTGSLATASYGTALGVIRALHERKRIEHVYCTETRPYNQGARLTAYELVHEKIPSTLVLDSMVAALMRSRTIDAVVVGADRIAANGDTANKIGTYQIAIIAKHHGVPFYVAAPFTSIDKSIPSGDKIKIEERPEKEMTHIGEHRIAAVGIGCWNPSFDVTPAHLIAAIFTEKGVFRPEEIAQS